MKNLVVAALVVALVGCGPNMGAPGAISTDSADVVGENGLHGAPEHLQLDRSAHAARKNGGGGSPLMTSHGGAILATNKTQAIFWGTSWQGYTGDKVSGLETFFKGFGGSRYAGTNTEYGGTNGQVTAASTYLGSAFDYTAAPGSALTTSSAVAEGCKITNNAPDANALYLIYTDTGAGHVSYCAWHSYGTCSNGAPIQVAYMPNLDGLTGCDPVDTYNTGHSPGLAALANVTAHELSETITDPRNGGWYDGSGQENGDKCAWTFTGPVTLANGTTWKLQGEWSNAAYNAGTGYANSAGLKGCLQGQ